MIKLFKILSEIKIIGNITIEMVEKLRSKIASSSNIEVELLLDIFDKYGFFYDKHYNSRFKNRMEFFNSLDKNTLKNFYKDLLKVSKDISEIKINRGPKTWDLTQKGVKFESIKEGDYIQFYIEHPRGSRVMVKQKVIQTNITGIHGDPNKYPKRIKTQDLPKLGTDQGFDYWFKGDIENHYKEYLKEIRIVPKFRAIPIVYIAEYIKDKDTEYLSKRSPYVNIIKVGDYYTFRPSGHTDKVLLFPNNWFEIIRIDNLRSENIYNEIEYINNLLQQGKYKMIN